MMICNEFCALFLVLSISLVVNTKANSIFRVNAATIGRSEKDVIISEDNSSIKQASTTEPSTTEQSTTEPSSTYPSTTEPSTTETNSTQPSSTYPATSNSTPAYNSFMVQLVSSNVPNQQYVYTAIGALQVCLNSGTTFNQALTDFLEIFRDEFKTEAWKLSSGCSVMILPQNFTYIKLLEVYTNTEINIFV